MLQKEIKMIAKFIGRRIESRLTVHENLVYNYHGICVSKINGQWRMV